MKKISSQDAAALLKQAGVAIRTLQKDNSDLREKVASFEKQRRVESIARDMEAKNLSTDLSFEEKVASLSKAQNLDVTEEAVKLAAPQGKLLADVSDKPGGGGLHPFEAFIATGEDPSAD